MEDGKHRRSLQFRLHLQSHLLPRFSRFPRLFSNLLPSRSSPFLPSSPYFHSLFHLYSSPTLTSSLPAPVSLFFSPSLFARLSFSRKGHLSPLLSSPPPLSIDAALCNHGEKSRSIRDPFAKAHLQTARPHLPFHLLLHLHRTTFF